MPNIFIISAPSGCGKTSLVRDISRIYDFLELTISCTTRKMRKGEIDGTDYHFVDQETFKQTNAEALTEQLYENAIKQYKIKSEIISRNSLKFKCLLF